MREMGESNFITGLSEQNEDAIVRRSMLSNNPELMRHRRETRASMLSNYPPELQQMNAIRRKPVGGSVSKRSARTSSESGNGNDNTTAATSPAGDSPSPVDAGVVEAAKAVMPYVGLKEDPELQQNQRHQSETAQLSAQLGPHTAAPQPNLQHQQPPTAAHAPQYVPYQAQPANQQQPVQQQNLQDIRSTQPSPPHISEQFRWSKPLTAEQEQWLRDDQRQHEKLKELLRQQQENQRRYEEEHPDPNARPVAPIPPPKIPLEHPASPPPAYDEVYQPKKSAVQPPELPPRRPALPPRQLYDHFTSTQRTRARSPSATSIHSAMTARGPNFDSILKPENIVDHVAEQEEAKKMEEATAAAHAAAKERWNMTNALQAGKRFTANLGRRATTGRRSRAFSLGSVKNTTKANEDEGQSRRGSGVNGLASTSASALTPTASNADENDRHDLVVNTNAVPAARSRVISAHKPTQSWDGPDAAPVDDNRATSVKSRPSSDRLSPVGADSIAANTRRTSPRRQSRDPSAKRFSMDWFKGSQNNETQGNGRNSLSDTNAESRAASSHAEERQASTAPVQAPAPVPAELRRKPYHVTVIRRDPASGTQEDVAIVTNANPENAEEVDPTGSIHIEIKNPGYNRFAGNSNPLAQGGLGINIDDLPPAMRESAMKAMAASGETFYTTGDSTAKQQPKKSGPIKFTRTLSLQQGNSRGDSQQQQSQSSGCYSFMSPWHGQCAFSPGTVGHSLKLKHSVTSVGAAGHLNYHRHHRRESSSTHRSRSRDRSPGNERVVPMMAAEIRFNLPLLHPAYAASHAHHGRGKSIWNSKPFMSSSEKEKNAAAAAVAAAAQQNPGDGAPLSLVPTAATSNADTQSLAGQLGNDRSRAVDFSRPYDENAGPAYGPQPVPHEQDKRMDLSLGRERGGGGMRGKSSKMGKLVVSDEGLKMLDLVVAACMGVWWNAYEAVDV